VLRKYLNRDHRNSAGNSRQENPDIFRRSSKAGNLFWLTWIALFNVSVQAAVFRAAILWGGGFPFGDALRKALPRAKFCWELRLT
jgi:hypothetical protein